MIENKKYDVIALGELLVDFTVNGVSEQGNQLFEANPGGAPCNVLSMLCKLGKKTAFIGKVGNDQFGKLLKKTLDDIGISTTNLVVDNSINTTLAFVHTASDGDRDFSFYRNPGADMMLEESEIDENIIKSGKIFHFGSISLTHEKVRLATQKALQIAEKSGILISFDPNLRPPLWKSLEDARIQIEYGLKKCDILKIAEEELHFMTGEKEIEAGIRNLKERYKMKLILVTLGKNGSMAFYENIMVKIEGYLQKNTVDTTGAGDTFCGCALNYVLDHRLDNLKEENLKEMLKFANAAASLITTKKGAIKSMPEYEEIVKLIT